MPMDRHRGKAGLVGVDGDHEHSVVEIVKPIGERFARQRKELLIWLAGVWIDRRIAVVPDAGESPMLVVDHQIGVFFGRHIKSGQTKNIEHMRADGIWHVQVQVNADDVVGGGSVGRVWFQLKSVAEDDGVFKFGLLFVQFEKDFTRRVRGRGVGVEIVDERIIVRVAVMRSAVLIMAGRGAAKLRGRKDEGGDQRKPGH